MRVSLFATCLADQLWPSVASSTVEVLRQVGCEVEFDERQTCCGQPAFNSGHRREARRWAERFIEIFEDAEAIVSPSGSCTAMTRHFEELFRDDEKWLGRARKISARAYELSQFLVNVMKVEDVGACFAGRLTWHDACHGLRDLKLRKEPRQLIKNVRGSELVELSDAETCCGFGGMFSVKFPEISVAILDQKMAAIERAGVDTVVGGDVGCLMQIGGRLSRNNSKVRVMHLAELLATKQ